MRGLIFGLFILTLAACARAPDSAQSGCARRAEADVTFSNPEAPDHAIARTEGPSCAEAVATLTLRGADGTLLWVVSAPYRTLTLGDGGAPDDYAPTNEEVDRFLAAWADLTTQTTSALPAWPESAARLSDISSSLSYDTHLPREAYELLRVRNLPEACFAIAAEGSECIVMDPASNEAISIVRFGP